MGAEGLVERLPMVVLVSGRLGRRALLPLHALPPRAALEILEVFARDADEAYEALREERLVYLVGAAAYEQMMEDGYGAAWRERERVSDALLRVVHLSE